MNLRFWKCGDSDWKNADERERMIAARLEEARAAKSTLDGYWRTMRTYYDGTHETAKQTGAFLASMDLPWQPCAVPDAYLHVEGQIEAIPPDFEFSARGDDDEQTALLRERAVRYVIQNNDLTAKNAANERRLNLYGSAVWKLSVCENEINEADIFIENPPLETIFPDPYATAIDDCEYIACIYRMNTERAARIFKNDLEKRGLSMKSILARKHRKGKDIFGLGDTVEIVEYWFRQPRDGEDTIEMLSGETVSYAYRSGDIALSILIEGTEVRYLPKFWSKTDFPKYPFVIYTKIPREDCLWGKSEIEQIIPLIDAADRQLAFAQLNTAFFSNDVLVYEENAFSSDSYPENRPGAIWKLRPGMMEKVKRLGGLAADHISHYEIADKYRAMMKEALGNYDFMQGDSSTQVTTATGLALLGDYASKRMKAKNICKKAGFERLYRLIDALVLEIYSAEKIQAITDSVYSFDEFLSGKGYVPLIDICVNIGEGLENSRSFTLTALSDLCHMEITEENYPIVRAYINALGIPERASLVAALDERFFQNKDEYVTEKGKEKQDE